MDENFVLVFYEIVYQKCSNIFDLQPHGKTWDKYGIDSIDTTGPYRTARERSGGEGITCPIA